MADTAATKPVKLPFWRTLGEAYGAVFGNLGTLLSLAGKWIVLLLPLYAVYNWLIHPQFLALARAVSSGLPPPSDGGMTTIMGALFWLIILIPLSAVAVGWHRFLLRNEKPGTATGVRLNDIVKQYAIAALIIGLIGQVPTVLQQLTAGWTGDGATAIQIIAFVGIWVALAISSRLSVALPAIAIAGPGSKFGEAWNASRRNTFRLLFGMLLSLLPMIAFSFLLFFLVGILPDRLSFALGSGARRTTRS